MGMTATEHLRELLDERGVEWIELVDPGATAWCNGSEGFIADEYENGKLELKTLKTPEQAIASTLGSRTCHKLPQTSDAICVVHRGDFSASFGYWTCSECGAECFEGARYCMNCGAKVVDE